MFSHSNFSLKNTLQEQLYMGAKFKCFLSVLSSLPMFFSYQTFMLTRVYIKKLMKRERDFKLREKVLSLMCSKAIRSRDGSKISVHKTETVATWKVVEENWVSAESA